MVISLVSTFGLMLLQHLKVNLILRNLTVHVQTILEQWLQPTWEITGTVNQAIQRPTFHESFYLMIHSGMDKIVRVVAAPQACLLRGSVWSCLAQQVMTLRHVCVVMNTVTTMKTFLLQFLRYTFSSCGHKASA